MPDYKDECPIWGTPAENIKQSPAGDRRSFNSQRAGGNYTISGSAEAEIGNWPQEKGYLRILVTDWLIEQRQGGNDCPEVTSEILEEIKKRKPKRVTERAENLLRFIHEKTDRLGQYIDLNSNECLAWSSCSGSVEDEPQQVQSSPYTWNSSSETLEELSTLAEYLLEKGWIICESGELILKTISHAELNKVKLSPAGYSHIEKLKGSNRDSDQAFVAMWFNESMKGVYEQAIEPAIREAGYIPMRIDRHDHINKIDDEIVAKIRRSRFVVADFTSQSGDQPRGGVYYEAGFAHGLNLPVIFTCREDLIKKIHFDTRQYNHLGWKKAELPKFRTALTQRICATIGDGPHRAS